MNLRILLLFSFCWLWAQSAYALDFSEFLSLGLAAPSLNSNLDPSLQSSPNLGFGGGITLGFKLFPIIDLELGLIYTSRSFNISSANAPQTTYSLAEAQLPFVVRHWFNDSFSAGLGTYFSIKSGNVTASAGSNQQVLGYDGLSWANTDLGLIASVRFRKHINELITIVVDERILFGLRNRDSSGNGTFLTRDLQTWMGIAFDL